MDFDQRLQKAIQRGQLRGDQQAAEARARELSEDELKRLHTQYRLQVCEHIEACVRKLPNHFPGFQFETIYGDRGWGAACKRDDVRVPRRGRRESYYSRLEMTVRPYSPLNVLEINAKGTVYNKETFNRNHFEPLADLDPAKFIELIDNWILEFAEHYASRA